MSDETEQGRGEGSRVKRFRARLAAGETVIGAWLTIPELSVAEIMAGSGFDYVIIDAEHAPWTVAEIQIALAGFRGSKTVLLVRVPWNDAVAIKQVLDAGIDGVVCPMVRTVEEARSLIAACRYPPAGIRGFGPRRASDYYRRARDYAATANAEIVIVPQIEDARHLKELDGILALDGVDAICLGVPFGLLLNLRSTDNAVAVAIRLERVADQFVQLETNLLRGWLKLHAISVDHLSRPRLHHGRLGNGRWRQHRGFHSRLRCHWYGRIVCGRGRHTGRRVERRDERHAAQNCRTVVGSRPGNSPSR